MTSLLEIKFEFPDWAARLRAAEEELNLFQAAQIQFNRGMLFDTEGRYNGHEPWEPLRFRAGMILSKRGTLRKSIAPTNPNGFAGPGGLVRFTSDEIQVGTTLLYARLMNDGTEKMPGGVLRPKRAKALRIPLPEGKSALPAAKELAKKTKRRKVARPGGGFEMKKFIFRKWVRIPARNFTSWNDADQEELSMATLDKVIQVLNRR